MHTVRRVFLPWNCYKEVDEVNERSRRGYHLVSAGRFSRKEEEDPSVCWYYRLDYREKNGYTELLHEKQGWEPVCRQGGYLWFRKEVKDDSPDSEFTLHGGERHALEDHFRAVLKRLDLIRNFLLVIALALVLIPGELTANWTPRAACIPLFLCILPVKIAGEIRKLFGEEKKSQ